VIFAGIYLAIGQPQLQRRFAIIRAVSIIGLIYPAAVRFGPLGVVAVIVFSNFTVLLMQTSKARKVINLEFKQYMRSYIPGLLMALPIIISVGLLRMLGVNSPIFILSVGLFAAIITFAGSLFVMNRSKL
jgi:hypothetical protein